MGAINFKDKSRTNLQLTNYNKVMRVYQDLNNKISGKFTQIGERRTSTSYEPLCKRWHPINIQWSCANFDLTPRRWPTLPGAQGILRHRRSEGTGKSTHGSSHTSSAVSLPQMHAANALQPPPQLMIDRPDEGACVCLRTKTPWKRRQKPAILQCCQN